MKIKIYTLQDPITKQIRYIGKTKNTLNKRLISHIFDKANNHKTCWIKSLKLQNLLPIIDLLDEVEEENWEFWEIYYISLFKTWNFKLTNSTEGGAGMYKYNVTNETKKKLSISNKNRKITWDLNNFKRKVVLYTIEGEIIETFDSIKDCSNRIKVQKSHISSCCKGKVNILKNKYVTRYINQSFDLYSINNKKSRNVLVYDLEGNLLFEYNSLIELANDLNCFYQQIYKAIKLRKGKYKSYIFKYKDIV